MSYISFPTVYACDLEENFLPLPSGSSHNGPILVQRDKFLEYLRSLNDLQLERFLNLCFENYYQEGFVNGQESMSPDSEF